MHSVHVCVSLPLFCFLKDTFLVIWASNALTFSLLSGLHQDMKLNTSMFMQLYAWYSWPNVVLCFLGGFLLDRVFGIR